MENECIIYLVQNNKMKLSWHIFNTNNKNAIYYRRNSCEIKMNKEKVKKGHFLVESKSLNDNNRITNFRWKVHIELLVETCLRNNGKWVGE